MRSQLRSQISSTSDSLGPSPQEPSGLLPDHLNKDSVEDLATRVMKESSQLCSFQTRSSGSATMRMQLGPGDVFRRLQEFSGQWLKPNIHTKEEQIVEMLVQSNFKQSYLRSSELGGRDVSLGLGLPAEYCCSLLLSLHVRINQRFFFLQESTAVMRNMKLGFV